MKFIATATALFAGLAAAASTKNTRTGYATLEFWAAADNTLTVSVPIDGSTVAIGSDLSFTSISSWAPSNAVVCHSYGVDGSDTVLTGSQEDVPIGPPQEQTYAFCESH